MIMLNLNMNFTAQFLKYFNQKILDENGVPISTIKYDSSYPIYGYVQPSAMLDLLKRNKIKEMRIKRISEPELTRLGFESRYIKLSKNERWSPQLLRKIFLCRKNMAPDYSFPLKTLPNSCYIEQDLPNGRIRLTGKWCGPTGYSEWVYIE